MKKSYYPLLILACSIVLLCSFSRAKTLSERLVKIDSIMEARPDSMLRWVRSMDKTQMESRRDKAEFAILMSMALEKNNAGAANFSILQPAIDYYKNHGMPTIKMRTCYYQGLIYSRQQDNRMALECYEKALKVGEKSDDILTKARIFHSQALAYEALSMRSQTEGACMMAADYFKQAKRWDDYAASMIKFIDSTAPEEEKTRMHQLNSTKEFLPLMSSKMQSELCSRYLSMVNNTDESLLSAVDEYKNKFPEDEVQWLSVAHIYYNVGKYEQAYEAITACESTASKYDRRDFYALKLDVLEKLGKYKEAVESGKCLQTVTDSLYHEASLQEALASESRHAFEMQEMKSGKKTSNIIAIASSAVMALLLIIKLLK